MRLETTPLAVKLANNHPSSSCWMHTEMMCPRNVQNGFVLLWDLDLNPTSSAWRAIAFSTETHLSVTALNYKKLKSDSISKFCSKMYLKLSSPSITVHDRQLPNFPTIHDHPFPSIILFIVHHCHLP